MQAVLWFTDCLNQKANLGGHSLAVTDVRFSLSKPQLATSCDDRTVKLWDGCP